MPQLPALIQAASRAHSATGIRQIVLSGGCMQNRRLASLLRSGLEAQGLEVFQQARISPGDGGLSYGQAEWPRQSCTVKLPLNISED